MALNGVSLIVLVDVEGKNSGPSLLRRPAGEGPFLGDGDKQNHLRPLRVRGRFRSSIEQAADNLSTVLSDGLDGYAPRAS